MAQIFTSKNGSMLVYDSTGTPYGLILNFENGDFSASMGRNSVEEILVLHRNRFDGKLTSPNDDTGNPHYIAGSDARIAEPIDISFSAMVLDSTPTAILNAVTCNGLALYGNNWATTKGDHTLTFWNELDNASDTISDPAFRDGNKKCVDLEIMWQTNDTGPVNLRLKYGAVYFELGAQEVSEAEDGVRVSLSGKCYGGITVSANTAFTTTATPS